MSNLNSRFAGRSHRPDYRLVMIASGLLAAGLVIVYSVSPGMSVAKDVSESFYIVKQLVSILLGVLAFIIFSRFPYKMLRKTIIPLVILSVVSLVAVRLLGEEINGAYRWIQVGGLSFQPVELVKFTLLVGLADMLAIRKARGDIADFGKTIKPILAILLLLAIAVGIVQSDFGSTAVMVGMIAAMMFIAGVPFVNLIKIGLIVVIGMAMLILPSNYRRSRVATFINPAADCQGSGYQSCQALIAVGSGGLLGMGLSRGAQAYGYLPEAANDSIFAILAEKFGFLGVLIILMLYVALFIQLTKIIKMAPDDFSRLLVTGVLMWFSVQTIINVGAMLGVLPLKGITLPFISYGGTSLLFIMGVLGIVFQISKYSLLRGRRNNESNVSRRRQRRAYNSTAVYRS